MGDLWLSPNAFDATRLRDLMLCRRRFNLAQRMQYEQKGKDFNIDLAFGSAGHEALRAYDTARQSSQKGALEFAIRRALELTADWPLETGSNAKTRATLIRALIWYDTQFGATNPIMPLKLDGNGAAMEVNFQFPLFENDPTGPQLCGNMDGIVEFGKDVWVLERKFTASALGSFYWGKFDPNVQVDVYSIAAHLMWPQWDVRGVLVEACQSGVTFARFERKMFTRSKGRLEEALAQIRREVTELKADIAQYGADSETVWRPRFTSCTIDRGCPFKALCTTDPSVREWELAAHWQQRKEPWDPIKIKQETQNG